MASNDKFPFLKREAIRDYYVQDGKITIETNQRITHLTREELIHAVMYAVQFDNDTIRDNTKLLAHIFSLLPKQSDDNL